MNKKMKNIIMLLLLGLSLFMTYKYSKLYQKTFSYDYMNLDRLEVVEMLPFNYIERIDAMAINIHTSKTGRFFKSRKDILEDSNIIDEKIWQVPIYEKRNFWRSGIVYIQLEFDENNKVKSQKEEFSFEGI